MTKFELEYWQHKAALLDPLAYVYMRPTSVPHTETVPTRAQWYCLNSWWLDADSVGDIQQFHRPLAVRQAVMFPGGTVIRYSNPNGSYSFAYWCRPERVVNKDPRYQQDPQGLYYQRLYTARRQVKHVLKMNQANSVAPFPQGFSYGLLLHVSCHDSPWVILTGPAQPGQDSAAMNVNLENSDSTPVQRFTIGNMLVPFSRSVFTEARLSTSGNGPDAMQGVVSYLQLPPGW
jgi:hypothetical protein